ncbi:hypothetical protein E4U42_001089 [Claviceps africana]|uniref:Uncharacterized protein n=1 Tax=Claviceps africana TaxID=83212 RepID=A0A8K0NE40_9HYPO|nr:hypothetical protein E4U42_001089 [Claviceps africana]
MAQKEAAAEYSPTPSETRLRRRSFISECAMKDVAVARRRFASPALGLGSGHCPEYQDGPSRVGNPHHVAGVAVDEG